MEMIFDILGLALILCAIVVLAVLAKKVKGRQDFWQDESGASAAEYALILAIVTTGIAGAVITLGTVVSTAVDTAANCIAEAATQGTSSSCDLKAATDD